MSCSRGVRWIEWASVPCAPRVRRAAPRGLRRRAGVFICCSRVVWKSSSFDELWAENHHIGIEAHGFGLWQESHAQSVLTGCVHVHGEYFVDYLSREPSLAEHDGRDIRICVWSCPRLVGRSVVHKGHHEEWFVSSRGFCEGRDLTSAQL